MNAKILFAVLFFLSLILFLSAKALDSQLASIAGLHLLLLSSAMFFLYENDLSSFLKKVGIPGNLKTNVLYILLGFAALFLTLFILSLLFSFIGFNDQSKVVNIARDLPLYVLALAVFLAPISEELFFRAFLSPRIGIFLSALIFGLFHFAYGSIVEIAGAFSIGIILAWIFKKSGSLVPVMIIHLVYNALAIIVMRGSF
jgi:hypothetical protein